MISKQQSATIEPSTLVTEQELLNEISTTLPKYSHVLLFAPHPDDEVFGAGGTLQKLVSHDVSVQQIIITSGDNKTDGNIAHTRKTESLRAANCLGLPAPIFWSYADRSLTEAIGLSDEISTALNEIRPNAVMVPGLDEVHPDHRATTCAVISAIKSSDLDAEIIFYEVSRPITHPNWLVDISDSNKLEAMRCFQSQQAIEPYAERIFGLNQYRSYHLGASTSAAEAFLKVSSQTIRMDKAEIASRDWDARLIRLDNQVRIRSLEKEQHLLKLKQQETKKRKELLDYEVRRLTAALAEIQQSTSWRITKPMRSLKNGFQNFKKLGNRCLAMYSSMGGFARIVPMVVRVIRYEGLRIFWWRVSNKLKTHQLGQSLKFRDRGCSKPRIIPYYLNTDLQSVNAELSPKPVSLAVHLHLFHLDQCELWANRLNRIERPFDLFISIPETDKSERHQLESLFHESLEFLDQLQIQPVPNRGRDLAPLIITFGEQLNAYQVIGHFHSKVSPHNAALSHWLDDNLDLLLGPLDCNQQTVEQIIELITTRASVVYPEAPAAILEDQSGWGDNWELAHEICDRHSLCDLSIYSSVEFPRGSMFWARSQNIEPLLNLPLEYNDFPTEPIPADGTLAHAIERLILVVADQREGEIVRLHQHDSLIDKMYYESPRDFSHHPKSDVRALAFYLPQFHPIAENDLWHGKGFTEWTKVQASSPLFVDHYQQHRPHPDIGYYLLDSPDPLIQQANLLNRAGLAGMVFYHYWFSGKLILEQPAQMLLKYPDIKMPFAMCWANENWTRRWDGNNHDVLLEQIYSDDDAEAFIAYLLPFFKDPRYIRIDGRPILLIYRPADLPDQINYLEIWNRSCGQAGITRPYYIGIMTRGANDPVELGMDAGLERVLHDWGGGHIPEVMNQLDCYQPLHGSVLHYQDVANFYELNRPKQNGTVFRSIVPQWDNTPRYGNRANVVHGSTPDRYEKWLTHLVAETREHMSGDERLIFINAWNEWAEGAHLEPDTQHGYAYLNATGRALYGPDAGCFPKLQTSQHVVIQVSQEVREAYGYQWSLVIQALKSLRDEGWTFYTDIADETMRSLDQAPKNPWCLQFRMACILTPEALQQLFIDAIKRPETTEAILCLKTDELPKLGRDGQLSRSDAFDATILLYPPTYWTYGVNAIRAINGISAFHLSHLERRDHVTIIVRFHNEGSLTLLAEALTSVAAQEGTYATPLIALQRPTNATRDAVDALISQIAWVEGVVPAICEFDGSGDDLRSVMLNEALQRVNTHFVGFLDYDDLLFPHACRWRINRLKQTGKAVTFGRIFNTHSDLATRNTANRGRVYEYNQTYDDFLKVNHCPLHGVLFNRHALRGQTVWYRPTQRYLEDYALFLQLVTADNTDWASLTLNVYVGEYRHFDDGDHTLAITDTDARDSVIQSKEYADATAWVQMIQKSLRTGGSSGRLEPPRDAQRIML